MERLIATDSAEIMSSRIAICSLNLTKSRKFCKFCGRYEEVNVAYTHRDAMRSFWDRFWVSMPFQGIVFPSNYFQSIQPTLFPAELGVGLVSMTNADPGTFWWRGKKGEGKPAHCFCIATHYAGNQNKISLGQLFSSVINDKFNWEVCFWLLHGPFYVFDRFSRFIVRTWWRTVLSSHS